MTLAYRIMYTAGLTPWDDDEPPPKLTDLVTGDRAVPPGRALDLGCGTGTDAVYLAGLGWQVTGVDDVPRALRGARRRAEKAGVAVDWVRGSVAALATLGLTGPYDLFHDVGCFHGLADSERDRYVHDITALSAPGATLLMFAFLPRQGLGPRGVSEAELDERLTPRWKLHEAHRDQHADLQGPMRNAEPYWFDFRRR